MKTQRVSKTVVTNVTAAEFEKAASTYAGALTREQTLNAKIEEAISKVREKFAEELKGIKEVQEESQKIVQAYCTENKETLFPKKKSIETQNLTIGFRTGTPKLVLLKGFNTDAAFALVKSLLPKYIRKTEEINKEALISDRETKGVGQKLAQVGFQVKQEEKFFIEPKKEKADVVAV